MTRAKIFTVLIFLAAPPYALAAVSGVTFSTLPQSVAVDTVSDQLTLQAQDGSGASAPLPQTGCILLQSTSPQGQFSSSATNWSAVSVLTMNKSTANKNFFYKDSAEGSYTLTARLALKPEDESRSCVSWPTSEWGSQWTATQTIAIGTVSTAPSPSVPSTQSQSAVSSPLPTSAVVPPITATVEADAVVSAGAGSFFEGVAYGSKGEPLHTSVRYLWNFGDGVTTEGKRVFHSYAYPGTYSASLTVSYNYSAAETRVTITAVAPKITLVAPGDGSLLIANESDAEVNVGNWSLRDTAGAFVIPEGTHVVARGGIRFAPEIIGFYGGLSSVLYFPNGTQASVARAAASSPLRGEPVSAASMSRYAAAAPLIEIPDEVDIYAPALPAEAEEPEVLGVATERTDHPSVLFWGSVAALAGLLVGGAWAVRHVQSLPTTETFPKAEEFEIE